MSIAPSKKVIKAIVAGNHGDPFAVFGMHADTPDGSLVVRTFQPQADAVAVIAVGSTQPIAPLEKIHRDGLFAGVLRGYTQRFAYRLRLSKGGQSWEIDDPYSFLTVLGDSDIGLLVRGNDLRAFDKLGAHALRLGGVDGVAFAVWAPNASRVAVVGDCNDWDGRRHPMRLRQEAGIWEIFIPGVGEGMRYKYEIKDRKGVRLPLKMDPYSFATEMRPNPPPSSAGWIISPGTTATGWRSAADAMRARRRL